MFRSSRPAAALVYGKESTPQLYIAPPQNYATDRTFPLFVYLYGGERLQPFPTRRVPPAGSSRRSPDGPRTTFGSSQGL